MKRLLFHKIIIGIFALFAFVISSNALLYGVHSVHELNHSMSSGMDHAGDELHCLTSFVTADHNDAGHEDPYRDNEPRCENHSHASIACALFSMTPISLISIPNLLALFKTPEVYLDKFIPPPNLV